ncbi:MAG: hypothetical protein RR009_02845 [Oscillospiraceae bacterium]
MKRQHYILIALFLAILIVPSVLFPLLSGIIDTENHENRVLAEFPDIHTVGVTGLASAFDSFYNDHLPFKNQFTAFHSEIFLSLFNTTSNPRVVVGKDGWLFYNNYDAENPIDDLLGISKFSDDDLTVIKNNISDAERHFAAQGKEFVLIMPPNKETVYAEYLPNYLFERKAEQTRADILSEYLENSGVSMVYPKARLLATKQSAQLYYKYDTHWNRLGGYVGFAALCDELGVDVSSFDKESVVNADEDFPKDLAMMAGIQKDCNDDTESYIRNIRPAVTVSTIKEDGHRETVYTSDAADKRSVLFIHDSYYRGMIDYLPMVFSEVVEVSRDYEDLYSSRDLLEKYDCDIVVMEVVERGASILLHDNMPY